MSAAKAVPLIPSAHLSEFGDLEQSASFNDPSGQARDHSYVPGFSDMKRAREEMVVKMKAGEATMADVRALDLPVNMRWARNQNKAGVPDNSKPFSHARNGYRLATKEDLGQPWLLKMPAGGQVQADGSIRNGDTILMVCDAKDAARNTMRKARETEARLTGSLDAFTNNLRAVNASAQGADPYVTKEPAAKKDKAAKTKE